MSPQVWRGQPRRLWDGAELELEPADGNRDFIHSTVSEDSSRALVVDNPDLWLQRVLFYGRFTTTGGCIVESLIHLVNSFFCSMN